MKKILVLLLVFLLLSACSKSADSVTPTTTASSPAGTAQAGSPAQAGTQVSAAPTSFAPFTVKPSVDNLNVRANPGYLFDILMMVQQTDSLTVLGTAPGHEWTYIKTESGVEGWVFTQLLKSSVDLTQVPVKEPTEVQIIKGRVTDASGTPIRGVELNITPGAQSDAPGNAVNTDANGDFFCYLPATSDGTWVASYTAIACESSVWSDSTCSTYKAGYTGTLDPQTISIILPQNTALNFIWK